MAVSIWNRSESKIKYIADTFELVKWIIEYTSRLPAKYRIGVGDELQHMSIQALYEGRLANSIYVTCKDELTMRRHVLMQMQAHVDTIATLVTALLDIHRKTEGVDLEKMEKLCKREEKIGQTCASINRCIKGLIEKDIERWNKQHPDDKVSTNWRIKSICTDVKLRKSTSSDEQKLHLDELPEYDVLSIAKANHIQN